MRRKVKSGALIYGGALGAHFPRFRYDHGRSFALGSANTAASHDDDTRPPTQGADVKDAGPTPTKDKCP
jgi:hypothetical protein